MEKMKVKNSTEGFMYCMIMMLYDIFMTYCDSPGPLQACVCCDVAVCFLGLLRP